MLRQTVTGISAWCDRASLLAAIQAAPGSSSLSRINSLVTPVTAECPSSRRRDNRFAAAIAPRRISLV